MPLLNTEPFDTLLSYEHSYKLSCARLG